MTREEAVRIFRKEVECLSHAKCEDCILEKVCDPAKTTPLDSEYIEAYGIAIQALEQEPSGDAISRKATLEPYKILDDTDTLCVATIRMNILQQPSVNPIKTGHWIEKDGFDGDTYYDCSECGESWTTIEGNPWNNGMKYCPNCGARMVEPQERSDKECTKKI